MELYIFHNEVCFCMSTTCVLKIFICRYSDTQEWAQHIAYRRNMLATRVHDEFHIFRPKLALVSMIILLLFGSF